MESLVSVERNWKTCLKAAETKVRDGCGCSGREERGVRMEEREGI